MLVIHMKPIQLTMDEELLAQLDATEEVKRSGRSAVIRRATSEYLERARRRAIAEQYRRGYSDSASVEKDFSDWTDEGVWPEE